MLLPIYKTTTLCHNHEPEFYYFQIWEAVYLGNYGVILIKMSNWEH